LLAVEAAVKAELIPSSRKVLARDGLIAGTVSVFGMLK